VIPARATVKFKPGKVMRQRVENLSAVMKEEAQAAAAAKNAPAAQAAGADGGSQPNPVPNS
jgi:hypothetical protein